MTDMEKLSQYLAALPRYGHLAGGWMLLLLAFVIGYDVVGRKFFNTGSSVLQEVQWHLHGAALMLGFGATYLQDAHVRVDLLRESFSPPFKIKLEMVGIVVFLIPYLSFLCYFSVGYTWRAWITGEGSVGGGGLDHRWIIKSFLIIGFFLVVLSALSILARCIHALRTGQQDKPRPFFDKY